MTNILNWYIHGKNLCGDQQIGPSMWIFRYGIKVNIFVEISNVFKVNDSFILSSKNVDPHFSSVKMINKFSCLFKNQKIL